MLRRACASPCIAMSHYCSVDAVVRAAIRRHCWKSFGRCGSCASRCMVCTPGVVFAEHFFEIARFFFYLSMPTPWGCYRKVRERERATRETPSESSAKDEASGYIFFPSLSLLLSITFFLSPNHPFEGEEEEARVGEIGVNERGGEKYEQTPRPTHLPERLNCQ